MVWVIPRLKAYLLKYEEYFKFCSDGSQTRFMLSQCFIFGLMLYRTCFLDATPAVCGFFRMLFSDDFQAASSIWELHVFNPGVFALSFNELKSYSLLLFSDLSFELTKKGKFELKELSTPSGCCPYAFSFVSSSLTAFLLAVLRNKVELITSISLKFPVNGCWTTLRLCLLTIVSKLLQYLWSSKPNEQSDLTWLAKCCIQTLA